ncbi:hypothetical protein PCH_Pc06g00900 [Penicillium rubens Wisconsin 54-1255]|uniref:Uncharacterized protein n=1 Tax=Penicillium rubens (strain ATCC 28089 / DSM 1075 / NRRL 1951 / Wisconsin 54-1255) TaxID=500485 RepID=B6GW29_PENRW|nr:hypothetical protein PCH_Pc06g00900 [Penicillium rubens Wisconsin 54-1255]
MAEGAWVLSMPHCKARKLKVASTPNHFSNVGESDHPRALAVDLISERIGLRSANGKGHVVHIHFTWLDMDISRVSHNLLKADTLRYPKQGATSGSFWKAVEASSDDMDLMAASGTPRARSI